MAKQPVSEEQRAAREEILWAVYDLSIARDLSFGAACHVFSANPAEFGISDELLILANKRRKPQVGARTLHDWVTSDETLESTLGPRYRR